MGLATSESLFLEMAERVPKSVVEVQRYNGLGELVKISTEDVGCVMNSVSGPVQTFAITVGRVENFLEIFDALRRSI